MVDHGTLIAYTLDMRWTPQDLALAGIVPDLSEGNVVTIRIASPAGVIAIMAEVDIDPGGRTLVLNGTHMQSDGSVGVANLRVVADFVLERMDCDEAVVKGAPRTSGANPGHRPGPLRFTRRPGSPSGP
jgi:hypothetical protein